MANTPPLPPPVPSASPPPFDPVALFGTRWNPAFAGQFGWRLHNGTTSDGTRIVILQLDLPVGRIALPISHDSARLLIRQLEEMVTGLVLPPP